jgi:hypothetical protein
VLLARVNTDRRVSKFRACVQVVNGDVAASKVAKYVQKEPAVQELSIKVVTAPAASRSADAVRAVADSLIGEHVVVMSGDTVSNIPVATVMFTHRIRGAAITTVLSKRPTPASEVTKLGKPPKGVDYVALDGKSQRLILFAYDPQTLRRITVPRAAAQEYPSMEVTTDLCDACIYVLSKAAIATIKTSNMSSIKVCFPRSWSIERAMGFSERCLLPTLVGSALPPSMVVVCPQCWRPLIQVDALPSMVNEQWKHDQTMARGAGSYMLPDGAQVGHEPAAQYLQSLCPDYHNSTLGVTAGARSYFCGVYLAPPGSLCRRVNTLKSLLDVSRELASLDDAGALVPGPGVLECVRGCLSTPPRIPKHVPSMTRVDLVRLQVSRKVSSRSWCIRQLRLAPRRSSQCKAAGASLVSSPSLVTKHR